MKLFMLTSGMSGYDTFDSCVVAARDEEQARNIHPKGKTIAKMDDRWTWPTNPADVTVQFIGISKIYKAGDVVLASFNAG